MSSTDVIYKIGSLLTSSFKFFEVVGNIFNYSLIVLGFFGFFYWMNIQKKLNDKAAKDPNQIK
jgi:hypothetical protein